VGSPKGTPFCRFFQFFRFEFQHWFNTLSGPSCLLPISFSPKRLPFGPTSTNFPSLSLTFASKTCKLMTNGSTAIVKEAGRDSLLWASTKNNHWSTYVQRKQGPIFTGRNFRRDSCIFKSFSGSLIDTFAFSGTVLSMLTRRERLHQQGRGLQ